MSDNNAVQRFFGHVLMAVGGLIALLCGGCTVVFLGMAAQTGNVATFATLGTAALVIGGLPTAVGVGLFVLGRGMAKDER
jgi:hypothetical protein